MTSPSSSAVSDSLHQANQTRQASPDAAATVAGGTARPLSSTTILPPPHTTAATIVARGADY